VPHLNFPGDRVFLTVFWKSRKCRDGAWITSTQTISCPNSFLVAIQSNLVGRRLTSKVDTALLNSQATEEQVNVLTISVLDFCLKACDVWICDSDVDGEEESLWMLRSVEGSFRRFGGSVLPPFSGPAMHNDFVGCWTLKMEAVGFSETLVNIC